jgi:Domain of unknown function (DUF4258)
MSEILRRVQTLVLAGDYYVSEHGFNELEQDAIVATEVISGIATALAIEDYVDRRRGQSVLALHRDADGRPRSCSVGYPGGPARTGYFGNCLSA